MYTHLYYIVLAGNGYPKYGGQGGQGGCVYVVAEEFATLKNVKEK